MPVFLLFVSAGILFDSAFSMWVSLIHSHKKRKASLEPGAVDVAKKAAEIAQKREQ